MCVAVVALELVVAPSPKSHKRLVMVPAEVSAKLTINGQKPLVGVAWKFACGIDAPVPVTLLVKLPSLALRMTTLLLKTPSVPGANWITTLVELCPGRLNECSDPICARH